MTKAPPAYQYYPEEFEHGTATFTLTEVGAYQRLLNYQWTNGSVPGDSLKSLALILRCTTSTAKSLWATVSCKFVKSEDGWRNPRMETERKKQADYRVLQANRGRASAEARRNAGSTEPPTPVQPEPVDIRLQPEGNSLSLSLSSKNNSQQQPRYEGQSHKGHIFGFCQFKCLSEEKIQEFAQDLPRGLDDPKNFDRVKAWAVSVRDGWGDKPKVETKWYAFWEARWSERQQRHRASSSDVPGVEETRRRLGLA